MRNLRSLPILLTAAAVGAASLAGTAVAADGPTGATGASASTPTATANARRGPTSDAGTVRVIVRGRSIENAVSAVRGAGGTVVREVAILRGVVADLPPEHRAHRPRSVGVLAVSIDRTAKPTASGRSSSGSSSGDPHSLTGVAYEIQADRAWEKGIDGRGIDVAVIDTGVSPVPGLANRIAANVDFSTDAEKPNLRNLDLYGHGTHIAGIITAKTEKGSSKGIAPASRIVNVKVGAADGMTSTSAMVAGIDWVVTNGRSNGLNVRVINISYAAPPSAWIDDPVAMAVGAANEAGFIVVAAAGNDATGRLASPAYQPDIISVAAIDQGSKPGLDDNVLAPYSSTGFLVKPTLGAPGSSIASLVVPGSVAATIMSSARVGPEYIKATGTSQASAVASGAAALMVQKWPNAKPGQIKQLLSSTAQKVGGDARGQGAGMIQLKDAVDTTLPAASTKPSFYAGLVQLSEAQAKYAESAKTTAAPADGRYVTPYAGASSSADAAALSAATPWSGMSWSGMSWSGMSWSGMSWSGMSWSGMSWSGMSWSGMSWSGMSWSSSIWG